LPKITSQIDLGPSQLVLEPGPKMKVLELKLPPGNIIALRVTSWYSQHSNCEYELRNLAQKKNRLNISR
ncbi:MAG: hypothetical protein EZS28_000775, partial [Streblomastix strix]